MINFEGPCASIIHLSSLNLVFYLSIIFILSCLQDNRVGSLPSAMDVQMCGNKDVQPSIVAKEDPDESTEVDEEGELSSDQIRARKKVNSNATIEVLCLKPSSLLRMLISFYRMVAMPLVRPTMSLD